MMKPILGVGAVLVAAVALAGCGGGGSSGSASGTVSTPATTTSGVAGASTTKTSTTVTVQSGSSSFNASASGLSAQIQKTVKQFASGKFGAAAASGASLLASCKPTVDKRLAPHATNATQKTVVKDLRVACTDLHNADREGMSGNTTAAKNWAMQAFAHAKAAAQNLR